MNFNVSESFLEFIFSYDVETDRTYTMEITITKPTKKLYLFNKAFISLPNPVIFGKIDIDFEDLLNETFIFYAELYANNILVATQNIDSLLDWHNLSFGKYNLKLVAFDTFRNRVSGEIEVWKFF